MSGDGGKVDVDMDAIGRFCFDLDQAGALWCQPRTVEAIADLIRSHVDAERARGEQERDAVLAKIYGALTGNTALTANLAYVLEIIAALRNDRDVALQRAFDAEAMAADGLTAHQVRRLREELRQERSNCAVALVEAHARHREELMRVGRDFAARERLEVASRLMAAHVASGGVIFEASGFDVAPEEYIGRYLKRANALIAANEACGAEKGGGMKITVDAILEPDDARRATMPGAEWLPAPTTGDEPKEGA